jgi:plasmid stabilization system protein ParE
MVRVSAKAWDQAAEASDWYAANVGLDVAEAFEDRFEEGVLSLASMPLRHPVVRGLGARHVYVPGFPFAIWYEVSEGERSVSVLGLSHGHMGELTLDRRITR